MTSSPCFTAREWLSSTPCYGPIPPGDTVITFLQRLSFAAIHVISNSGRVVEAIGLGGEDIVASLCVFGSLASIFWAAPRSENTRMAREACAAVPRGGEGERLLSRADSISINQSVGFISQTESPRSKLDRLCR